MTDPVESAPTPAPKAPAAPAAPVTPVVETPAPAAPVQDEYHAELAANIASARATLTAKDEPVATEEAAPETEVAPEPETTEEVAPVVEPEPPKIEVPEGSDRVRFSNDQDAKIARLKRDHPEMTFAQCEEFIKGKQAPAGEVAPQADPAADELAQVQAALDAHAEAGDLPTPEIRKMQRRESELLAEQRAQAIVAPLLAKEQERQAKEKASEDKAFEETRVASGKKAAILFPEAYKKGSELYEKVIAHKNAMEDPSHPDHSLFDKADLPELLIGRIAVEHAEEVAKRDGIPFADAYAAIKGNLISVQPEKSAAPSKQAPPVTAARKPAVTAPGNVATRTPDRAKTDAEKQAELDAMTPVQRFEALFGKLG